MFCSPHPLAALVMSYDEEATRMTSNSMESWEQPKC